MQTAIFPITKYTPHNLPGQPVDGLHVSIAVSLRKNGLMLGTVQAQTTHLARISGWKQWLLVFQPSF